MVPLLEVVSEPLDSLVFLRKGPKFRDFTVWSPFSEYGDSRIDGGIGGGRTGAANLPLAAISYREPGPCCFQGRDLRGRLGGADRGRFNARLRH